MTALHSRTQSWKHHRPGRPPRLRPPAPARVQSVGGSRPFKPAQRQSCLPVAR